MLLPISELNAASGTRSATHSGSERATSSASTSTSGAEDVAQTRAAWAARALPIPIKVVPSPYRDLGQPLLAEIRAITADPDAVCVVVMPEIISPHRWQRLLHNQRALFIKRLLLFEERVVLTSVPYRLPQPGERAPAAAEVVAALPSARGRRCTSRAHATPGVVVEQRHAIARYRAEHLDRSDLAVFEGFAGSMALLAVTLVGLLLLRDHLSVETVALVFLLPPLVAALSGRALALVMAAFGALLFNFFFLRPYYTLSIGSGRDIAAFLVYAAVAMLVAVVAGRLRQARAEADQRVRQEQALHEVAIALLAGTAPRPCFAATSSGSPTLSASMRRRRSTAARAIVAGEATPALLGVDLPSVRYHAAAFGERGRIVIDGASASPARRRS